jgi:formate dehydrogenase major subunit
VQIRSDHDMPEGTGFLPFCYADVADNLLMNPGLEPFGNIPEFKCGRIGPTTMKDCECRTS